MSETNKKMERLRMNFTLRQNVPVFFLLHLIDPWYSPKSAFVFVNAQ